MLKTDLLVIGAGPYGLAAAAYAGHLGVEHVLVGNPMSFWRDHMPDGMLLRSPLDWQIDPLERRTLRTFLQARQIPSTTAEPLPVEEFRAYAHWFQEGYALAPLPIWIAQLERVDGGFLATAEREQILAESVVLTPGFAPFAHVPPELQRLVPEGRYSHTCDEVSFNRFRGRRCLIIGGRQSAYEWAALLAEAGAERVHISHRHAQPHFEASDWSWVATMIDATASERGWWRNLPEAEREAIRQRFWAEGRLKLEPWLPARLPPKTVQCHPHTNLTACDENGAGELDVLLDSGAALRVDHVIFATGYRVETSELPLLAHPSIKPHLRSVDGFPLLGEDFQTSVDGLYMAGLPATRDFGPFFGFVSGAPLAARMIVERVAGRR
jgi:thioredoxin reductase